MNRKGVSLMELVVATALAAIVVFVGATLLKAVNKQSVNAGTKFTQRTLLATITGSLQKHLASGDLRFFAFSGLAAPHRPLARAVLPYPASCGDFPNNDAKCADDVGLLYVHYDKLTTPTVSVLCNYVTPKASNHLHGKWLVDLYNDTYGPPVVTNSGFDIQGPASAPYIRGPVNVSSKQTLALMNPPLATLWVAVGKPVALTGIDATTPNLGDCTTATNSLRKNPSDPTKYLVDKLYTVEYMPLIINQFTGGTGANLDENTLVTSQGPYPLRLFSASFRSVGRKQVTADNYEFAFIPCDVGNQVLSPQSAVKTTFACTDKPIATVPGIAKNRIEEIFAINMNGKTAERFELIGTSQTKSASCGALCDSLPMDYPTIPSVSAPGGTPETFENLDGSKFSLLKKEAIKRLRFKLTGTNGKEDAFDIIFP